MQAEIYHLFHSSVAIKIAKSLFIFDYFKDQFDETSAAKSALENGLIRETSFSEVEKAYVFVSHSHHDHYNPVIFDWEDYDVEIEYIMAAEVNPAAEYRAKANLYLMEKDNELELDNLKINTYGSTDKGVSFLVNLPELSIFHAGDLNWWKWKRFSEKVQEKEERDYKKEIKKLLKHKIDLAFVPVDPRLEEYYYLAGEYFIDQLKPAVFVPIHFADNYDISKFFAEKMAQAKTKVAVINERGQKINFNK